MISKDNLWDSLFKSLDKFSDDFMAEREQPDIQVRKSSDDIPARVDIP